MTGLMPTSQRCSDCGAAISADERGGLCARCLLSLGLSDALNALGVSDEDRGSPEPPHATSFEAGGTLQSSSLPRSAAGGDTRAPGTFSSDRSGEEEAPSSPQASSLTPHASRFGDYDLLEEIARGGGGIVYRARQRSLNRIVALKLLLFGQQASPEVVRRFRVEASAAGALQHPNIVAIHEVGLHEGQHYLAMDFVDGPNLAQAISDSRFTIYDFHRTARCVRQIAEAVHYAHERGILHRDLKPSNILLDANDQPRVTDFGLAKRLVGTGSTPSDIPSPGGEGQGEGGSNSLAKVTNAVERVPADLTLTGQVIGSPAYMPPEQASADHRRVGRSSDVYSLGAILYHLLTGRAPFQAATPAATMHQALHTDPLAPRLLQPGVPADLETICLKCLEKEPAKRYPTAQALADELNRFLHDEPIHARPVGRVEKAWRWCRRKPALAGLWAAMFLLLVAVFTGIALAGLRDAATRRAEQREYFAGITLADNYVRIGDIQRALDVLTNCPPRFRQWEWGRLMYLCHQEIATFHTVTNLKMAIVGGIDYARLIVNADQTRLVTVGEDGAATVWELRTGAKLFSTGGSTNRIIDMAFSPDGQRLALLGNAGAVEIWDASDSRRLFRWTASNGPVRSVSFSGDGTRIRVTSADSASTWDSQTGQFLANAGPTLQPDRGSPDPQRVEPADDPGKVPTLSTSQRAAAPDSRGPGKFQRLALDPTGTRLATVDARRKVQIWEAETGQLRHTLDGRFSDEARLFFSPDGKRLVVADPSGAPSTVWNTAR
jgi:serine/threonine protein kinase